MTQQTNRRFVTLSFGDIEVDFIEDDVTSLAKAIFTMSLGHLMVLASQAHESQEDFDGLTLNLCFTEELPNGESLTISPPKALGDAINDLLGTDVAQVFVNLGVTVNYVEGDTFAEFDLVAVEKEPEDELLFDSPL